MRERDDEAKAPTRQITGHKDLLFSSELDESVTNAIEIRQMQQAEFVTAVYRKCSRHKESSLETKSRRHIRAKPRASRLMILEGRPFGFTRECETSFSREVGDDAILREVEILVEGSKDVCEVVYIAGDADKTSEALSCRTS